MEISGKGLLHFNKRHSRLVTELITGQTGLSTSRVALGVHSHCGKWQNVHCSLKYCAQCS